MPARTPSIARALAAALKAAAPAPADAGGAALARRYAAQIDAGNAEVLAELGPKLLAVLESLRMTPKARQQIVSGGVPDDPRAAALADLRNRRAAGGARQD